MNCQRFESVASELARGQMIEAEVRAEAFAHRAECLKCSAQLRDEEMLTRGLRALAHETSTIEVPSAVESALLSAFRDRTVVVPLVPPTNYRRYWLTAVAALFLIVFSVVAIRFRENRTSVPQVASTPNSHVGNSAGVQPSPAPEIQTVKDDKPKRSTPVPKRRFAINAMQARASNPRAGDNNVLNHASNEVATEFMPLGYLNPATLQDGGQIVRVELPRSALANFGLPVNMDRYNEKVKADVLLGVDGTAHAIRFVQEKRLQ